MSFSKVLKSQDVNISQITLAIADTFRRKELPEGLTQPETEEQETEIAEMIMGNDCEAQLEEQLELKSQAIINKANQEAALIIQKAQQEAALLKNQAYELGYLQGSEYKINEIHDCIAALDEGFRSLEISLDERMNNYEKNMHLLAIEIASKILHKNLAKNDLAMLELTKHAVGLVKSSPWIEVTLSNKLHKHLKFIEKELKVIAANSEMRINFQEVPADTCIVESLEGIIDASLSTQINNLKLLYQQIDPRGEVSHNDQ